MIRAKSLWDFCPTRSVRAAAAILLLLAAGQSAVFAQSQAPATQEIALSELLSLPGTVIGQGRNERAAGPHKVATYRVEHLTLPRPVTAEIGGKKTETAEAFRLTILGGPFPVRALPPVVWVDDVAVGYGVESEDLTAITVVTFDRALLREGASIYLSYGDKENREDRSELPEKLSLGGPKGGAQ
ncbi:MAG TPA: hypothetical protein VEY09_01645 [Pyrinomonadaceae bacterium]|nr:hypothetical protein [Pyrinomonadaceae bacterium]